MKGHPRLFFSAEDLPALRAKAKDGDERGIGFSPAGMWRRMTAAASRAAEKPLPPVPPRARESYPWTSIGFGVQSNLIPLAIVYAVGGPKPDGTTADLEDALKASLMNVCRWRTWGPVGPLDGSHGSGDILSAVAIAYDCIWARLTAEERQQVTNAMVTKALAPLCEARAQDSGRHRYAYFNNGYPHAAGNIGLGALALLGEVPQADAWVEDAKADIKRVFKAAGVGGWNEGYNYGSTSIFPVLFFADALKRVTGDNLFREAAFLRQLYLFPLYGLSPNGGGMVNFCDSYYFNMWPAEMAKLASEYRNGYAQWYLMKTATSQGREERRTLAQGMIIPTVFGFLWYDPTVPTRPPVDLPQSRHFDNIGWVMLRSGWNDQDILFAFKSGVPLWTHCHQDQNHFVLNAFGQWLVTDQDYGSRSNRQWLLYQVNGVGHNIVGYNGKDELQPESLGMSISVEALEAIFSDGGRTAFEGIDKRPYYRGRIRSFFTSPSLDYVAGDASSVYRRYKTNEPIFARNLRRVLFVKPDYFLILDDLETTPGLVTADGTPYLKTLEVRLHIRGTIAVEGEGGSRQVKQVHGEGFVIPGTVYSDRRAAVLSPTDLYKPPRAHLEIELLSPERADFVVKRWPGGVAEHFGPYLEIVQHLGAGRGKPFFMALRPVRSGDKSTLQFALLKGMACLGARAAHAERGSVDIALFRLGDAPGPMRAGTVRADGRYCFVRRDKNGKVAVVSLGAARKLVVSGKTTMEAERRCDLAFTWSATTLEAEIDMPQAGAIWIYVPAGARRIEVDGAERVVILANGRYRLDLDRGKHEVRFSWL